MSESAEQRPRKITSTVASAGVLYVAHVSILLVGCLLGILAAYGFNSLKFNFSGEIEKAKDLGIVSLTILSGYPKSKDLLTYLSTLAFPIAVSISIWYLWARNRQDMAGTIFSDVREQKEPKNRAWAICLISVVSFYLIAPFRPAGFYLPGWSQTTGAWVFLGEDGENLAWVQSIFSGGVYGRDFYCLYGPMLIYPLAWVMKLFGSSVVVERVYRYALDMMSYGVVIFFLYKTLRSKALFVSFSIAFLVIFPPFVTLSVNFTYLRFALGLLPLLVIFFYFGSGKKSLPVIAGVIVAQSILFSQEAGISSLLAVLGAIFVRRLTQHELPNLVTDSSLLFLGGIVSAMPIVTCLVRQKAWGAFVDSIYGFPKLSALGYAGVPIPSFKGFITDPFGEGLLFYLPIFVYVFAAMYIIPFILIGKSDRYKILKMSVLIFGVLLFAVPVRRYSAENVHKVLIPCIVLIFLILDSSMGLLAHRRGAQRVGHAVVIVALLLAALVLSDRSGVTANYIDKARYMFAAGWDVPKRGDRVAAFEVPLVQRGGVLVDAKTAISISRIGNFLSENTSRGDYVYFFPNEAVYYFLFDRNNPTRYAMSYFAITAKQRRELIRDLEKNKPVFVVYSRDTWRVDGISEFIQVPEVVNYLNMTYRPYEDFGNILILKRISS